MTRRTGRKRRTIATQQRGVAMLMVIIALGAATVLSGAYLASRRNTGAIGQNAMLAIRAQWASRSGLELGMAILQTNEDWRTAASDGVLIDDLDLSGADVRVVVTNLEGLPPEADDDDVVLTAVASVRGVESSMQRVVVAPSNRSVEASLNTSLDEFGVFAVESLAMQADSIIATWPLAPRAALKAPVKVGLANGYNSALSIDNGAHLVNAIAYAPSYASASLKTILDSEAFANSELLPVVPPSLMAVGTGFDALEDGGSSSTGTGGNGGGNGNGSGPSKKAGTTGGSTGGTLNNGQAKKEARLSGKNVTSLASGAYSVIEVKSNAVVELAGDYSVEQLDVLNNGEVRIVGDTRIEVIERAEFRDGGALTFADDQVRAVMYLRNELRVRNTALGATAAIAQDIARTSESITAYQDPSRLRIYGAMPPPDPLAYSLTEDPPYEFDDSAIVVAAIHAPNADVRVRDQSAIIGRITALRLTVESTALVLTDPTLDNHAGYTTLVSQLYKSTGEPVTGLESAVASVDPNIGVEGLDGYIAPRLTLEDPLGGWVDDGSGVSPRRAMFVQPTEWPLTAMLLEADNADSKTTVNDGSLVVLDASIEDLTILRLSLDGSSGGTQSGSTTTKSSMLKTLDPTVLEPR